jgi:hypothetical protein
MKNLTYQIAFTIEPPPLTPGVSLCPSFDLNSSSLHKNFTDDTYYLELTNNLTDRVLSPPKLLLNCARKFTLIAVHVLDIYNLTNADRSRMAQFPLRLVNLKSLEVNRVYELPVFMFYHGP